MMKRDIENYPLEAGQVWSYWDGDRKVGSMTVFSIEGETLKYIWSGAPYEIRGNTVKFVNELIRDRWEYEWRIDEVSVAKRILNTYE
jgi:hypothetical protein